MAVSRFVVHEHHATNLHWDFRLELDNVLISWAVPKGPPANEKEKRLAIKMPDHQVSYIDFEGELPEGTYGAGKVLIWDNGTYELLHRSATEYTFILHGKKLDGSFALFHPGTFAKGQYLFIKHAA